MRWMASSIFQPLKITIPVPNDKIQPHGFHGQITEPIRSEDVHENPMKSKDLTTGP